MFKSVLISICFLFGLVNGGFLFQDSFTISSQITANDSYGVSRIVTFEERYSHEQKRARIEYHVSERRFRDPSEANIYLYDSVAQVGLLLQGNKCYKGSLDSLYEYLFPGCHLPAILAQDGSERLSHLVGPAKILFIIDRKKDELRQANQYQLEGRRVFEYHLDVKLEHESEIKFKVHYGSNITQGLDSHSLDVIPLQVEIISRNNSMTIIYFCHRILTKNSVQAQDVWVTDQFNFLHSQRLLDQFSFPLLANCPQVQSQDQFFKKSLIQSSTLIKFSFLAESSQLTGSYFVAFDGSTSTLRVDSLQRSKTIYNFRSNRKYGHVKGRPSNLVRDQKGCLIVEALSHEQLTDFGVRSIVPKLLFGSERLNYMGKALIRGIASIVYEAAKADLPIWYDQSFFFEYKSGQQEVKAFNSSSKASRYTTLIYLSDESRPRLLLLELYEKQQTSSMKPSLSLNFFHFTWSLAESPEGDQLSELFSLGEECYQDGEENKYEEVSLLLKELATKDEEKRMNHWIHEPSVRNEALLASLTSTLPLEASMIGHLNSRPTSDSSYLSQLSRSLSLVVKFGVREQPSFLHHIKFVGFGKFLKTPTLTSLTVESEYECLLSHSRPKEPTLVFYLEEGPRKECFFNHSSSFPGNESELPEELLLTKESEQSCKVYRIEPQEDSSTKANRLLDASDSLENKEMIIMRPNAEDEADYVKFTLERLNMRALNEKNQGDNPSPKVEERDHKGAPMEHSEGLHCGIFMVVLFGLISGTLMGFLSTRRVFYEGPEVQYPTIYHLETINSSRVPLKVS